MSIENGKCPSCGGPLLLDSSKEKITCRYCGHEVIIPQAVNKCVIDGLADFDTMLLNAQDAADFDKDYDKARKLYKKALELRPRDYKVLWGLYLCEIEGIKWARDYHGFVQTPGDIPENVASAKQKYGDRATAYAPDEVKPYYYRIMQQNTATITNPAKKKKGCYIATAVYGSYNCPEVWVLRRYRDYNLDTTKRGRAFIKCYYTVSPLFVKLFGKTKWFNHYWRKKLDKKVALLKAQGYEDTPYDDKY